MEFAPGLHDKLDPPSSVPTGPVPMTLKNCTVMRTNMSYPNPGKMFFLDVRISTNRLANKSPGDMLCLRGKATSYDFKTKSKRGVRIWGDLHVCIGDVVHVTFLPKGEEPYDVLEVSLSSQT